MKAIVAREPFTRAKKAGGKGEPYSTAQEAIRSSEPNVAASKATGISEPYVGALTPQDYEQVATQSSYRLIADGYLEIQKTKVKFKAQLRKRIENLQLEKGYATLTKSQDDYGHNIHVIKLIPEKKEEAEAYADFLQHNDPGMKIMAEHIRGLEKQESMIKKEALEIIKDHPIWQWIENTRGLSEVSALTYMGYINPIKCSSVGKIWAYCGLTPFHKLKRGEQGNYNPQVKARMWLQAKNVIMAKDPYYYALYKAQKEYYENREKAIEASEPPRKAKSKAHLNNMAVRWLAKLLIEHAWEFIRLQSGLPINKHHDHIPPKPYFEDEQQREIAKFRSRDIEGNRQRWAAIKARAGGEPNKPAQEARTVSEPIVPAPKTIESSEPMCLVKSKRKKKTAPAAGSPCSMAS